MTKGDSRYLLKAESLRFKTLWPLQVTFIQPPDKVLPFLYGPMKGLQPVNP